MANSDYTKFFFLPLKRKYSTSEEKLKEKYSYKSPFAFQVISLLPDNISKSEVRYNCCFPQ